VIDRRHTDLIDALAGDFLARFPADAARALQPMPAADVAEVLARARPREAAAVLARLGPEIAASVARRLPADATEHVLIDAEPMLAAALVRRLDADGGEASVLARLPAARRREIEGFLAFPENSAGDLMDPRAPVFRHDARVVDVVRALTDARRVSDQVLMITDDDGRLIGTIATVEALMADADDRLDALRLQSSPSVEAFAPRDEIVDLLDRRRLVALPVLDLEQRPIGLIGARALAAVAEQDAAADVQTMVGASRDERALSTAGFAVRKRLPWLQINLATAFLAAAVVGLFEATIARFTALAILLPVVAGQSGNAGAQSLAVTMRGLSLHEIGIRHWLRVATKEATVGFTNGLAVAGSTMAGVFLWSGSWPLCAVIGLAMVMSMTVAGVAGASVPMVLRAVGQDPAQSSSIVLTTVTDVVGFSSFLGLAALFAAWL
jgi:magnesium transporter